MPSYQYRPFPYTTPPELKGAAPRRWPVVVVGAGPVGLAAAIDLALHEVDVLLLDDNNVVSIGSRAICWSKRTLEILDRLGCGERMAKKGVTWKVGRLYHREREIYSFDLLPETGHKMPAFINLQQYYAEEYLVDRARELEDRIELRWNNRVVGLERFADHVRLAIETPDGPYQVEAEYVLAADGGKSPIRSMLGLDFTGRVFEERFLITDVVTPVELPNERRFWFEPPFHEGQSALLHRQPDNMYRIDLQLGWDADPELEKRPERVIPRVRAVLGRGHAVRGRVGQRLHLPVPPPRALRARPRDLHRRQRARGQPVRRARRQRRHPGRRQPGLEARAGAEGRGAGRPARDL